MNNLSACVRTRTCMHADVCVVKLCVYYII